MSNDWPPHLTVAAGTTSVISSIAYDDPLVPNATEATLTLLSDPDDLEARVDGATYGPLKAASERAGTKYFGESSTMVRPTYVIGSFDTTLRFPYWVERARRGGEIAAPGPLDAFLQYIDARDLANFVVRVAEETLPGPYHVAGPTPSDGYVAAIEAVARHIAPEGTHVSVVSPDDVRNANLTDKFPLWSEDETPNYISALEEAARSQSLRVLICVHLRTASMTCSPGGAIASGQHTG